MSTRSINDKIILVVIMMEKYNSIINTKNYGKIKIKLKEIMDNKNINKNRLSVLTGIKFDTIQKYYNDEVYRIDVDVLAKFCYALDCKVQDIVEYKK
jgi:putative transcriptional regulator